LADNSTEQSIQITKMLKQPEIACWTCKTMSDSNTRPECRNDKFSL